MMLASSSAGSGSGNNNRSRPHPASRSVSDSMPSTSYFGPSSSSSSSSKHKRTYSGSSPDTAQTASSPASSSTTRPSPDRQYSNVLSLYESHLRQLESRKSYGLDALPSVPSILPASARSSPRSTPRGSHRGSPRNSFHLSNNLVVEDDEAMARQLQDAELAASLQRAERASADFALSVVPTYTTAPTTNSAIGNYPSQQLVLAHRDGTSTTTPTSSTLIGSCRGRTLHFALRMLVVVLMAGITFIVYVAVFGKLVSDRLDPATWLPGYPESDPSMGSVGKNSRWIPLNGEAEGNGLSLTVLNNLVSGSNWDEYLQTAIADWNNGTPDAVTLQMRSMSTYDPDCQAVRRAMKVCNGNYGPTDWRGVNQILLQDNYIVTSLAKMNDYYLEGTDVAQKQYTMCHELGHGLGLGHVDENFYNADLGNCMDYTEHPENNMHPDDSNYEALAELYGVVYYTVSEEMDVPENRMLVAGGKERMMNAEFEKYASRLSDPVETSSCWMAVEDEDGAVENSRGSCRLLLKTETYEHHERDLGNGFSIRTSILLA